MIYFLVHLHLMTWVHYEIRVVFLRRKRIHPYSMQLLFEVCGRSVEAGMVPASPRPPLNSSLPPTPTPHGSWKRFRAGSVLVAVPCTLEGGAGVWAASQRPSRGQGVWHQLWLESTTVFFFWPLVGLWAEGEQNVSFMSVEKRLLYFASVIVRELDF